MNKKIVALAVAACLATSSGNASCESSDTLYPVKYIDAIRAALVNRPEIAMERANVERATARAAEARGAFLPSLDTFSTIQRIKSYKDFSGVDIHASFNNIDIPVSVKSTTPPYQISAGVELSYNIYSGGFKQARVSETLAMKSGADAQKAIAKKKVILDVTTAYWSLRKAQITHRMAERSLEYARDEASIVHDQFKQGNVARIEVDTKILAVQTRELELENTSRNLLNFQRRYSDAIGLIASSNNATNVPSLSDNASDIEIGRALSDFDITPALETIVAKADLESAMARVDQARSEYKPVVDMFIRHTGIGRGEGNFGDASSDFGKDSTVIGVRFKWNLFDGGQKNQRVVQANALAEQMQLKIEQTKRDLNSDLQEKSYREADLQGQLTLSTKQLELVQAQLKISKTRLETKQISILQYHAAQLATEDARDKVAYLEIDLLISRIGTKLAQ